MGKKIVIIGGVALGPKAASRARRRDADAEITIIERGDVYSYAGCGMPFYIEGLIEDCEELLCTLRGVRRDEAYFKDAKNVTILGRTEATRINRREKTVTVQSLETGEARDIPYDKLVLGTGASVFVPPMPGVDLEGVHRLYDPHDAQAIRRRLEEGVRRVVIVGGGLIGMEVCGAFVSRGCDVTVVEMMDQLVPALLDKEMALLLENYLREQGVDIRCGSGVSELIDDGGNHVKAVETASGDSFEAEMVIMAIGVRPNTQLARDAGLDIGETRAIAVNEYLQTSDPDIYAGGDCVEVTNLVTGAKAYLPLGSTANKHGRVIGDNVTGGVTKFPGVTATTVFKVLEYNVGRTGLTEREAKELGYDVVTSIAPKDDVSHYYPGAKPLIIKLVADRDSYRLLGAQALGPGDLVKRIDIIAACLKFGAIIKDVADLDLGYAPPYSTAIDAVQHAANILRNKVQGWAHGVSPLELKERLDSDQDFVLLDVRSEEEAAEGTINDPRLVNIPLPTLKDSLGQLPRDKEIIAFCRTSVRAYTAERQLRGEGYRDVKFLDGSVTAWPFPLSYR